MKSHWVLPHYCYNTATLFLRIPLPGPLSAGDSKDVSEMAVTVWADTAGTNKTNANNSPGPDGTQPRNPNRTQAWNWWITNTMVCHLSIRSILVVEDCMVAKVTDFSETAGKTLSPKSVLYITNKNCKNRIRRYLGKYNPAGKSQHGFCNGMSWLTSLLELYPQASGEG